ANAKLRPEDVTTEAADGVLVQLEIPLEAVARATESDAFVCLNAAPARAVPDEVLGQCDLIVANSLELDALGSTPLGPLFAVTLGAQGAALLASGGEGARAPPPRA